MECRHGLYSNDYYRRNSRRIACGLLCLIIVLDVKLSNDNTRETIKKTSVRSIWLKFFVFYEVLDSKMRKYLLHVDRAKIVIWKHTIGYFDIHGCQRENAQMEFGKSSNRFHL
jgi:hypothetical protein